MNPEDVLVRMQLDVASAIANAKRLEGELLKMQGVADQMHVRQVGQQTAFADALDSANGRLQKMLVVGGAFFAEAMKIKMVVKLWETGVDALNGLISNLSALQQSADMSNAAFASMQHGITQAAIDTGESIGAIAQKTASLVSSTGLRDGIGEIVVASENMNKVFGVTSESFSSMAADAIKMSNGLLTGKDVMDQFNHVTGLMGAQMEAVLGHLKVMTKELGNALGGGSRFADTFKSVAKFAAGASAEILKMGGDPEAMRSITESILDPNRWEKITEMMPGMAGNLVQMQQALASNDMETFGKLLKEGAQRTVDMGAGMNAMARASTGWDFRQAEVLAKLDFHKASQGGAEVSTVMQRSMAILTTFGVAISRFFNAVVEPILDVVQPVVQMLLGWFNKFNDLLSNHSGFRMFVSGLTVLTLSSYAALKVIKLLGFGIKEAAQSAGESLGKGIGKGMESMGNGFAALGRGAVGILAVGGGLLMAGGAFYLLALGIERLQGIRWDDVSGGLLAVAVAMGTMLAAGAIATFIAPGLLALGAAVTLVGAGMFLAGAGIAMAAPAMQMLAASLTPFAAGIDKLAASHYIMASLGIAALGAAFGGFALTASLAAISMPLLVLSLAGLSDAVNTVTKINPTQVKTVMQGIAGAFNGLQLESKVNINDSFLTSVKGLIDSVLLINAHMAELLSVGAIMKTNAGGIQQLFKELFGSKDALLVKAITSISDNLQSFFGNTTIDKNVAESFTSLFGIIGQFSNGFVDLTTMSLVMKAQIGGKGIKEILAGGIDDLFGKDGVMTMLTDAVSNNSTNNKDAVQGLQNTMSAMSGINIAGFTDSILTLGALRKTGAIHDALLAIHDVEDGISGLDKFSNSRLSSNVKISTKTAADIALRDYDTARAKHETAVEGLLTEIRDAVRATPQQEVMRTKVAGDAPSWNPENAFAQFGPGDW